MMSKVLLEGWTQVEKTFPSEGTPGDKLRFLLEYAVLAPSSRNAQPWLFRVVDDTIELYADRGRSLPVIDPQDREMFIACGAALFHLRIALRHFGYAGEVEILPDPKEPNLLAKVHLGQNHLTNSDDELLFQAIPQRHTNRWPFTGRRVPDALLPSLQQAADKEGAGLHIVADTRQQYSIAGYVAENDHIQWGDSRYRHELAEWLRPNDTEERDGLPGYALGMGDVESTIAPLVMDASDLSKETAKRDYKLALSAPVLAVLWTRHDEPSSWLAAGQALARVLLHDSAESVSAAFFNQTVELGRMRALLAASMDLEGSPQMLFRLGYAPEVKPTPRRSVEEVLL